jgi:glycosyltransferase involved in cell wall biosynthesis
MKVVESLALGVPVVTGEVGDRREVIGEHGVIVEAGDAEDLAKGIADAIRDARFIAIIPTNLIWESLAADWSSAYR